MRPQKYRWMFLSLFTTFLVLASVSPIQAERVEVVPRRIVSLAPSTTEVLFALGLGDKVAGVTRYCDYPASAASLSKVGGLMDPNYEEIAALKPDLIILLTSHGEAKRQLEKLGITTLSVPHQTIDDIHRAILLIGEACGVKDRAVATVEEFNRRTRAVARTVKGESCPRVLICIGRDIESGQLSGMYMAGCNGFHDEIIELAGGVNAYRGEKVAYPQVSAEGVIRLDPDVIVDLVSSIKPGRKSREEIAAQWEKLPTVSAVQKGRLRVVAGTHALRPGPRYIRFLEEMAAILHPEAFPKEGP